MDWETPLGRTSVVAKVVNPSWYPPASVHQERIDDGRPPLPRIVPPGPDNPLGSRAMRLGLPGYLIHGTNRPAGVGMRVTHGCIRMFPEDIEFLFDRVPVNTRVRILNEPIKVGWDGDELVMEVHPVLEVAPAMTVDEPGGPATPSDDVVAGDTAPDALAAEDDIEAQADAQVVAKDPLTYATESFIVATRERAGRMDWSIVESLIGAASGMPARVGMSAPAEEDDGLVSQEQRAD
jgi:L,D-transpeptidase ErfK/SrfK